MKFRVVHCKHDSTEWYEVYYRALFMWFPVTTSFFASGQRDIRQFATKEQAVYWIDMRKPAKKDSVTLSPTVSRTVIQEYDH